MFLLGLILPVCFIPGITGASIPTQWVLLSGALGFFLWRPVTLGPAHWLGLLAAAWALISVIWAHSYYDAAWGLWMMFIWGLSFRLGFTLGVPWDLLKGLAWGMTINSFVALAQWLGFHPVLSNAADSAGLLFNNTVLGGSAALVILALLQYDLYLHVPGVFLGLVLSGSRGAWVTLVIGILASRVHWIFVLATLSAVGLGFMYLNGATDIQRLYLWSLALSYFNILGNAIGSYNSLYYVATDMVFHTPVRLVHPEFVHNDYLQLWFELGIGALPIYGIYAIVLSRTTNHQWPVFVGFATMSFFYFPLWCPVPSFIGCVVAGHCCAQWHRVGCPGLPRRHDLLRWGTAFQRLCRLRRHQVLPLQPPNAN